jgi:multiple sugar transport system ATP-binding protein
LGAAQVVALFHERLAMAPGDVVHLRPKPGTVHLFDPTTGVRMEAA